MTFLQALYGSQYMELAQKGKDCNKGRLNANLFLSAFIMIVFFLIIVLLVTISEKFTTGMNSLFHQLFGYASGKTIGRLLAIPLMFIISLLFSNTVGSKTIFEKTVGIFNQLPEEEKKKANARILGPFMVALAALFILSMISMV